MFFKKNKNNPSSTNENLPQDHSHKHSPEKEKPMSLERGIEIWKANKSGKPVDTVTATHSSENQKNEQNQEPKQNKKPDPTLKMDNQMPQTEKPNLPYDPASPKPFLPRSRVEIVDQKIKGALRRVYGDRAKVHFEDSQREITSAIVSTQSLRELRNHTESLDLDAPNIKHSCDPESLLDDWQRGVFSLEHLASWGNKEEVGSHYNAGLGYGWGKEVNDILNGGVSPGQIIGVGSSDLIEARSDFLMQLADGLALRNSVELSVSRDVKGYLCPALVLSSTPARDLYIKTFARWTEISQTQIRARRRNKTLHDQAFNTKLMGALIGEAGEDLKAQAANQKFTISQDFVRYLDHKWADQPADLFRTISEVFQGWVAVLRKNYPQKKIMPFLFIDPLEFFLGKGPGRE